MCVYVLIIWVLYLCLYNIPTISELDNDYLRQRHLFMLKDLRKGYITADKQTDIQTGEPPVPSA